MVTLRKPMLSLAAGLAILAVAILYLAGSPGRAQSDQSTLGSILSWALSTPENRVSIGQVEGALSSNATIRDVRISDRDGVWLTVDRAQLVWSRTALFAKRLQIDTLEIDRLTISRRPVADETAAATAADAPVLPELPVKIVVGSFTMRELALGESCWARQPASRPRVRPCLARRPRGCRCASRPIASMRRASSPWRSAMCRRRRC